MRWLARMAAVAATLGAGAAQAADGGAEGAGRAGWCPDAYYVQLGVAEHAHAAVVGALWEWGWMRRVGDGVVAGHWDVEIGRWGAERDTAGGGRALVTQVGVTPSLRWQAGDGLRGWFAEAGVGAHVVSPLYQSRDKRFSTRFNFGSHLAVGRRYGARDAHEWSLRVEHFSNAGIRRPNPGENFLQLRWAYRY